MTDQDYPACIFWPVPPYTAVNVHTMHQWQNMRCAFCGYLDRSAPLVLDHDHNTGFERGYLCRSCNVLEPRSPRTAWVRYRAGWNPAMLLGHYVQYVSPFSGMPVLSADAELADRDANELAEVMRKGAEACGRIG